ncbi:low molecular weight phosphotyrosine protein phosphatase [Paroceanicella profunda]|uniref:protein-tyrosine-phosphatase n=1 Tax=Paroceanicella profunda TaxID=2579971 RepID=A0A5B8G0A1_9RHOB|nr:low molecular weight protein-tyrosine-phosphatase [Paroceanicella profunda]QDL92469.1 low molecular weight phosphotyrosine protein phosphatase [Paroceanicella profunda]
MTTRILFVCLGNICRSPAAQGVMDALLAPGAAEIDSAGIGGWHAGDPPDPRMCAAAAARGIDLSAQRARKVLPEDFARFDLILAMDADNLAALEALRPAGSAAELHRLLDLLPDQPRRDVPDPYYGGASGFDTVLDLVDAACRALATARHLPLRRAAAGP